MSPKALPESQSHEKWTRRNVHSADREFDVAQALRCASECTRKDCGAYHLLICYVDGHGEVQLAFAQLATSTAESCPPGQPCNCNCHCNKGTQAEQSNSTLGA